MRSIAAFLFSVGVMLCGNGFAAKLTPDGFSFPQFDDQKCFVVGQYDDGLWIGLGQQTDGEFLVLLGHMKWAKLHTGKEGEASVSFPGYLQKTMVGEANENGIVFRNVDPGIMQAFSTQPTFFVFPFGGSSYSLKGSAVALKNVALCIEQLIAKGQSTRPAERPNEATTQGPAEWTSYENGRFGYRIDIPAGFSAVAEAFNGDGGVSLSADGSGELRVWGGYLVVGGSDFLQEVRRRIDQDIRDGWKVTYREQNPAWASSSGTKGDRVFYERAIIVCDGAAANFRIEYNKGQLNAFDPVVVKLVKSFRSGTCSESAKWVFRDNGVFVLKDNQRSLSLGGTFARENLDRFLKGATAEVIYTEYEDCAKCYYVNLENEGSLFVNSPDASVINQISGYGPLFIDDRGVRGGQKVNKGIILYCDDGEEEVCVPQPEAPIGYIIDRQQCETSPISNSGDQPAKREFTGCEIVTGFSIANARFATGQPADGQPPIVADRSYFPTSLYGVWEAQSGYCNASESSKIQGQRLEITPDKSGGSSALVSHIDHGNSDGSGFCEVQSVVSEGIELSAKSVCGSYHHSLRLDATLHISISPSGDVMSVRRSVLGEESTEVYHRCR